MVRSLVDLGRGVYRHPWKTAQYIFTSFSVLFTLVKAVTYFIPAIKIEGPYALAGAVIISIGFGLRKVWRPSRVDIPICKLQHRNRNHFRRPFQARGNSRDCGQ
jgi:hypothetical protein